MKTWRYENGTWHEDMNGLPLCSPEPGYLGDRQIRMEMFARNGYRHMQRYAGPGGMIVWLYEKEERNILAPEFVALVSVSQEHIVLLPTLPDLMDWLARYRPCFQKVFPPLECGYSTDEEEATETK